jgi:predicted TIM-barrel fold metal-dependent hydrolase
MLIDIHTHMFPDKLAPKALSSLSKTCKSPYYTDGTVKGTVSSLKEWGVTANVVMNIATKPSQQTTVNNWAASIQDDHLFCFGSVHPDAENAIEELARIKALGLYGVKFHPDYQDFFIDEERMFPIYDAISSLELPVLFHAGADPLSPNLVHAPSKSVAKIADMFPKMKIIAAHLGGMNRYDEAEEYLAGKNIYIDTAMASRTCSPEQFARIINKHGADHVLFASDCPWSRSIDEFDFLQGVKMSDDDREKICYRNAMRLLNINTETL